MSRDDTDDETQSRAERLTDRRSRSRERIGSAPAESDTSTDADDTREESASESQRSAASTQAGQTGQTGQSKQDGHDGDTERSEGSEWSQASDENVKRENVAVYMYLDPELQARLAEVFADVEYHYQKAYSVELEKNRHVYPLVLEHGIETVREMAESPAEVRAALEANPYTETVVSRSDPDT